MYCHKRKKKKKPIIKTIVLPFNAVAAAQKNRCWLCGAFMIIPRGRGSEAFPLEKRKLVRSKDHVVPSSTGGKARINNVLFAHIECNTKRGNTEIDSRQAKRARMLLIGAVAYNLASITRGMKCAQ